RDRARSPPPPSSALSSASSWRRWPSTLLGIVVGVLVGRRAGRTGCRTRGPSGIELAESIRHDRGQAHVRRHAGDVAELEGILVLVVELLLAGRELHVLPGVRRLPGLREEAAHLGEVGNLPVPVLVQQIRAPGGGALVQQRYEARPLDAGIGRR